MGTLSVLIYNVNDNMRSYLFESAIWGNHAKTIKDRQTGSVASYYLPWGGNWECANSQLSKKHSVG